jgi:hypothetical protein
MGFVMIGVRAIKSRASAISRLRLGQLPAVVGPPPVLLHEPELMGGFYGSVFEAGMLNLYKTAPALTLTAWIGEWDEVGGETTITADFYDQTQQPLGAVSTTVDDGLPGIALEITSEHIGLYIHARVIASRGGVTLVRRTLPTVMVQPVAETPEINGYSQPAPRIAGVNQPVGKPNYVWSAGALITPVTITGEWFRNNVATGVTGNLFPDPEAVNPIGRETAEGDLIRWQETCTNAASITGVAGGPPAPGFPSSWETLVTDLLPALRANMRSEIASRISGLPGGVASMNVYSTAAHNTGAYVFNENNWAADLRYQLTAHFACQRFGPPAYNQFSARYGFFLITPRHILTCAHIGPMDDRRYVRFFTHDNRLVEARLVAQATYADGVPNAEDNQIILLDRDMSMEDCHTLPILNAGLQYGSRFYDTTESDRIPLLGVSQDGVNQPVGAMGSYNASIGIPENHTRMLYIKLPRAFHAGHIPRPAEYNGYHYEPYKGDSGGPIMILAHGKFFIVGQHYDAGMIDTSVIRDEPKQAIINLIAAADAKAVAQGLLSEPTGLLPDFVRIDEVESYPVPRPRDPRLLLVSEADPSPIFVSESDPTPIFLHPYA